MRRTHVRWRLSGGERLIRSAVLDITLQLDASREEAELRTYLGAAYEPLRLQEYRAQFDAEFEDVNDEHTFYRTSQAYLYDLTAFAMSGTKLPYLRELLRYVGPGARILDYGCGIGSDGLLLLEAGCDVAFADFDNPSTRYLRWRLARRGMTAEILDLDGTIPCGFDAAYAFDVIEHVPDPYAFLARLEASAELVEVNLLEPAADDPDAHRELPIADLLEHVARSRLLSYRIFYDRSHLVVYQPRPVGGARRVINRAVIRRTRWWHVFRRAVRARLARHGFTGMRSG